MKISDSIRKWCDLAEADSIPCDELRELADRIDSETVELPKDRDGVPIHVGDTVYSPDGKKCYVDEILPAHILTQIKCKATDATISTFFSYTLSHTRPDSFERIADELDERAGSITKDGYAWQEDVIHDFADRIRKLAEKEEE